jgi:hypothetical protein
MAYEDAYSSRDDRFSIGVETRTDRHCASFPVSNGPVDYEEYYEITPEQYREVASDHRMAHDLVQSCRRHERNELLIEQPERIAYADLTRRRTADEPAERKHPGSARYAGQLTHARQEEPAA